MFIVKEKKRCAMRKSDIKSESKLTVCVNGTLDIRQIPQDIFNAFITALEQSINDIIVNKETD